MNKDEANLLSIVLLHHEGRSDSLIESMDKILIEDHLKFTAVFH